jgi:hypothetical protein
LPSVFFCFLFSLEVLFPILNPHIT